jgi:membrane protein
MGTPATPPGGRSPDRPPVERLRLFFTEKIWAAPGAGGRYGRRGLYRVSRIATATAQGFLANRLTVRAAALTYYTVLSLVPFLAFAFAILKGFGVYRTFVDATLRPYVRDTFGENASLLGAMERVLRFVDRTDVSALGVLGLVALVYTCLSLLGSVEDALNEAWGARTRRTFLRQVTDYVTLLVITPLLTVAATAVAAAAQSSFVVEFLRDALGLGVVIDFLLHFTSVLVVGLALFAVYLILPNARVRALSAAVGAAVAALAWQAALIVYVRFQVGVSNFNALYSVLSAIPIFLVWTYVSWIVVLVGAQVAASHQNERTIRQRLRATRADQALRETLALLVAARVARAFVAGVPWRSRTETADLVELSPLTIEQTLDALVRGGVLARTAGAGDPTYLPARDLDALRVEDVRAALRKEADADGVRADLERHLDPGLLRVLRAAEEPARDAGWNLTLRELAAVGGGDGGAGAPEAGAGAAREPPRPRGPLGDLGRPPVLDAK